MPKKAGTVRIHIADKYRQVDFSSVRLKKMLGELCRRFSIRQGDIIVSVVDDKQMKKVNREFLGRSSVTDVISFDLSDEDSGGRVFELVINAQQSRRQAKKRHLSAESETWIASGCGCWR
jgi:ssRNA-specific RNase YbeY (16S rRNA maturation enzyme)